MKEKLKVLYNQVGLLLKTGVSLFSIMIFSKYGLNKNRGKRTGQMASLLANGPSVKDILTSHRDLIKNTDIMVLNSFASSIEFWEIRPKFYIILDPVFFIEDFGVASEETNKEVANKADMLISELLKVDWNMTFYIPQEKIADEFANRVSVNKNISVYRYNATRIEGFDSFQNWAFNKGLGVPSSRNVIIPALLMLANCGYEKIYLYGTEFSWTKIMDVDPDNGKLFFNDRHFYSKSEIRFFGKGGYLWWLKTIADELYGVEQIAKYANSVGVKIINRTKGSFIDSFEYENPDILD